MDEQFQETKPLAPPSKFAESDLAKAASTFALGSNESDDPMDRDAPLIANLDTEPQDPQSQSGSDSVNSAAGVTRNFRTAMNHGREVCDAYVHDNPWNAVVLAGAVGLFVGLLLSVSSARSGRSR